MSGLNEALKAFAKAYEQEASQKPLLIGVECYEFFGERCMIVGCHYVPGPLDTKDTQVIVETVFGDRQETEFSQVSWRP